MKTFLVSYLALLLAFSVHAKPQFGSVRVSKVISVYDGGLVF